MKTNIEDMSLGCTETWSPAIHGPTGSLQSLAQDQEGFALYCWPQVCKQMANHRNFYKDSPGHELYNGTTTTTETAATRRNCTTLRTSTTTTSTTTTESTTTQPENVTHPLKLCCNEKVDNRGMLWTATCGLHNLTTHCPDPAPGFAVWTCDTTVGEFIPKQVRFCLEAFILLISANFLLPSDCTDTLVPYLTQLLNNNLSSQTEHNVCQHGWQT